MSKDNKFYQECRDLGMTLGEAQNALGLFEMLEGDADGACAMLQDHGVNISYEDVEYLYGIIGVTA